MCQLSREGDNEVPNIVTKAISEIDFQSSAYVGDIIEIGCNLVSFGTTSVTLECEVRNKQTQEIIVKIDKIVFVRLDKRGRPTPHGFIK